MTNSARTSAGTAAGRKGRETRQRILDAVEERCLHVHHREIAVGEIARSANVSPATFYTYFPDLVSATAEIAQRHLDLFSPVVHAASRLSNPAVEERTTKNSSPCSMSSGVVGGDCWRRSSLQRWTRTHGISECCCG